MAIRVALREAATRGNRGELYLICSDSQIDLQALGRFNAVNPHVAAARKWASVAASRGLNIEIYWVPGPPEGGGLMKNTPSAASPACRKRRLLGALPPRVFTVRGNR